MGGIGQGRHGELVGWMVYELILGSVAAIQRLGMTEKTKATNFRNVLRKNIDEPWRKNCVFFWEFLQVLCGSATSHPIRISRRKGMVATILSRNGLAKSMLMVSFGSSRRPKGAV